MRSSIFPLILFRLFKSGLVKTGYNPFIHFERGGRYQCSFRLLCHRFTGTRMLTRISILLQVLQQSKSLGRKASRKKLRGKPLSLSKTKEWVSWEFRGWHSSPEKSLNSVCSTSTDVSSKFDWYSQNQEFQRLTWEQILLSKFKPHTF